MKIASAVLKKALQKLSPDLSPSELSRKRRLDASRSSTRAIEDLSGIEVCTALTDLDLSSNLIEDLSPLSGLVKLQKLHLHNNKKLRDLSPLATLTQLEVLYLAGTMVEDVGVLARFSKLTTVSLSETNVADISVLDELQKLQNVVLRDCGRLVVEEGNATYATVTRLLDRGVDVYLNHPLIEQYKPGRAPH